MIVLIEVKTSRLALALLLLGLCFLHAALPAPAAPGSAEKRAFEAAGRAFDDGFHERAEKELADFAVKNPRSELLAQVVLLQAQARYQLKHYEGVAVLLNQHLMAAGPLQDEYRFWLAEAQFQSGHF